MNNEFYVFGDVHNYVTAAQAVLNKYNPNRVIWLGDFTDMYDDTPSDMVHTARFLKKIIEERPQDTFILSNHDVVYRSSSHPNRKYHYPPDETWGWSKAKDDAFHSVFPREYWKKFVLWHKESYLGKNVYFTHAGLSHLFFVNGKFDEAHLKLQAEIAISKVNSPNIVKWLDNPASPLWIRWPLPILDGICQVVGHTPSKHPQVIVSEDGQNWNLNLDCAKNFIGHFTDNGIYALGTKTDNRIPISLTHNLISTEYK